MIRGVFQKISQILLLVDFEWIVALRGLCFEEYLLIVIKMMSTFTSHVQSGVRLVLNLNDWDILN